MPLPGVGRSVARIVKQQRIIGSHVQAAIVRQDGAGGHIFAGEHHDVGPVAWEAIAQKMIDVFAIHLHAFAQAAQRVDDEESVQLTQFRRVRLRTGVPADNRATLRINVGRIRLRR